MFFDKHKVLRDLPHRFDQRRVLYRLGYKMGKTDLSRDMTRLVEDLCHEALDHIQPQGVYILRKIKNKDEVISFFKTDLELEGRSMQDLLQKSFAAIIMAVTLGHELETAAKIATEEGRLDKALILDAIGSEAVESAANDMNAYLVSTARLSKYFLTSRFSPGYGDLSLNIQKEIHRELLLESFGVEITEKNLLFPQKTITAIIGVEK